jgi:hypothetical protein
MLTRARPNAVRESNTRARKPVKHVRRFGNVTLTACLWWTAAGLFAVAVFLIGAAPILSALASLAAAVLVMAAEVER